ncbi:MAG: undecaprenyldiphospho-muramoylpentapeptide beta-N-acetylglucosaminyltransferase [Pseudomonadota bacterium]
MNEPLRIMIAAGGTGGHVFPALAVAEALTAHGCRVGWLGTRRGLESRVVASAGFELFYIAAAGLRGKQIGRLLTAPFMLLWALMQALVAIARFRPDAVLGMGGYVAGPSGLAAWLLRRPLLIHEQNAVAGMTNRVLTRFAARVMEAFPGSFKDARVQAELTGNPVRATIAQSMERHRSAPSDQLSLLVFGGSQGAAVLNERVPLAMAALSAPRPVHICHQAGRGEVGTTQARYHDVGVEANVVEFIDDMDAAYQEADLAICRSGAMTVAELAIVKLPAILVPFPFAVDDHQTHNAKQLSDSGAAIILSGEDFNAENVAKTLDQLIERPAELALMAQRAGECAKPGATQAVTAACMEVAGG